MTKSLTGICNAPPKTPPAKVVCEYCNNGNLGSGTIPFSSCLYCGASPSYHHGRCCTRKPHQRPHSIRSEVGHESFTSGTSYQDELVEEKIVKDLVIDSGHTEEQVFELTWNYIHDKTPFLTKEDAIIVNTYIARTGFHDWFAKKVKAYKKAEKSETLVQNLKKIVNEELSSSGSSGNSSWQQVGSPSGNSLSGKSAQDSVCLTDDNIPFLVAHRNEVCVNCNILGHKAGDLICVCVQKQNFPVSDLWKEYREHFSKLCWSTNVLEKPNVQDGAASPGNVRPVQQRASASSGNQSVQRPFGSFGRRETLAEAEKAISFNSLVKEFTTKISPLNVEQRQNIINTVDVTGTSIKQAKAIYESVEKTMSISQKGYGVKQDGW
jgi:hypothetical protein